MRSIFPTKNRPKFDFPVGVINPRGIPTPKGIDVSSKSLVNFNSHGIYFPMSKSDFSVSAINPKGIPIPMGFIFPS